MIRRFLLPLLALCALLGSVAALPVDASQGPSIPQRLRAVERRVSTLEARRAHYNIISIPGTASNVTTDSLTSAPLDLKSTDEVHFLLFATAAYTGAHSSATDVYNALNNGTVGGQIVDVSDSAVAAEVSCSATVSALNTVHVDCAAFTPGYLIVVRYR